MKTNPAVAIDVSDDDRATLVRSRLVQVYQDVKVIRI